MNTNTGELGELSALQQLADDPADVVPIPKDLERQYQNHLRTRGRFVDLKGRSRLARFARDHQRRKKAAKSKARALRKQTRKNHQRLRRRQR